MFNQSLLIFEQIFKFGWVVQSGNKSNTKNIFNFKMTKFEIFLFIKVDKPQSLLRKKIENFSPKTSLEIIKVIQPKTSLIMSKSYFI